MEVLSNHLRDFRIGKSLHNLEAIRQTLASVTDRFAVSVDFPFFQRLALPLTRGQSRIPGIQIHNTRMIRLMEVLLHSGPTLTGWSSREIYQALLQTFTLSAQQYTLTQLRYDLHKMKGHGLIERVGRQYRYRLTDKGHRASLMFVLFHQRVCGPLASSCLQARHPTGGGLPQSRPIDRANSETTRRLTLPLARKSALSRRRDADRPTLSLPALPGLYRAGFTVQGKGFLSPVVWA